METTSIQIRGVHAWIYTFNLYRIICHDIKRHGQASKDYNGDQIA